MILSIYDINSNYPHCVINCVLNREKSYERAGEKKDKVQSILEINFNIKCTTWVYMFNPTFITVIKILTFYGHSDRWDILRKEGETTTKHIDI